MGAVALVHKPGVATALLVGNFVFLAGSLVRFRKRFPRNPPLLEILDIPRLTALIPLMVGVFFLISYAAVLTLVHGSGFSKRSSDAIAAIEAVSRETKRIAPVISRRENALTQRLARIARRMERRTSQAPKSRAKALQAARQLQRDQRDFLNVKAEFDRTQRQDDALLRRLTKRNARGAAALPPFNYLPAWFGRLGSFFSTAAQILAALLLALVFEGRAAKSGAEANEQKLIRTGLHLTLIGLAAAVVGLLPGLGRGPQAFLLGLVGAGVVTAITTLAVARTRAVLTAQ